MGRPPASEPFTQLWISVPRDRDGPSPEPAARIIEPPSCRSPLRSRCAASRLCSWPGGTGRQSFNSPAGTQAPRCRNSPPPPSTSSANSPASGANNSEIISRSKPRLAAVRLSSNCGSGTGAMSPTVTSLSFVLLRISKGREVAAPHHGYADYGKLITSVPVTPNTTSVNVNRWLPLAHLMPGLGAPRSASRRGERP